MSSKANNFIRHRWPALLAWIFMTAVLYLKWWPNRYVEMAFFLMMGISAIPFGWKLFTGLKGLKGETSPWEYVACFLGMIFFWFVGAMYLFSIFNPKLVAP